MPAQNVEYVNEQPYDIFDRDYIDGKKWVAKCSHCLAERREWGLDDLTDGKLLHDCDLDNEGNTFVPKTPLTETWGIEQ